MIDELLPLLFRPSMFKVCEMQKFYFVLTLSQSLEEFSTDTGGRGSLLLELVHGCRCNHCLCCYLDQKDLELVTLYEDVLHPPRTRPIQRART